tara:strand:- start:155 stop:262 length:108 start_codon:yes stop_codon:yes gene_type:complete
MIVTPMDIMIVIFLSTIAGFLFAEALTLLEIQQNE